MYKKSLIRKIYSHIYKILTPFRLLGNILLTWRYPWIAIYDWRKEKRIRTHVWASPWDGGWNKAFFFPMMERIRKAAKKGGVYNILQIEEWKSKYGGLRIYVDNSTEEINEIIHEYECISENVCENCGEPDVGSTKGWITPICERCYKKFYNAVGSYEENVGNYRIQDFYKYRKAVPGQKDWADYSIDIRDKANEIRRLWNIRHPFQRKEYSKVEDK